MPLRSPMISTRVSFRWVPDPPSERTSTIVLTSPRGHFVDVRLLVTSDTTTSGSQKLTQFELDWAFAGTAKHEIVDGTSKGTWTHLIDSQYDQGNDGEPRSSSGVFEDLPDGNALEKGRMEDPEKGGEVREYEEVWNDEMCKEESCWVLSTGPEGGRRLNGMMIRIGNVVQGVFKAADGQMIALRSRYGQSANSPDDEKRWEVEYEKGPAKVWFVRPDAIEAQEGDRLISPEGIPWVIQEVYRPSP